jgi:tetrahydromethanopterin S-methyltransferase subunit B
MAKENTTSTINQLSIQMAKIGEQIKNIEENVGRVESVTTDIKKKLESDYATKEWVQSRYDQTKNSVNGFLVAFGLAIVAALAAFVIRGGLK